MVFVIGGVMMEAIAMIDLCKGLKE